MNIQKKAFTLVELIVSISIVAILASIWFYSYVWYLGEARDSKRKANAWEIKTALKLYKQKRWAYPIPWNYFNITNTNVWGTTIVALQWELNENVTLSTMDEIPLDPHTGKHYTYSVTKNKQESQIALTLENWDFPIALLEWDYKTVSKDILPSIILAISSSTAIEIHDWVWDWTVNRDYFILNGWINLPYSLDNPYNPHYWGEDIDDVLIWWTIKFWQNSDYRDCTEIEEAAKMIHTTWLHEFYQILDNTWVLTNTGCTL